MAGLQSSSMEEDMHHVYGDNDAMNSPHSTLSRGTDFEVVSEKVLWEFQKEMTDLISWFESPEIKRKWPEGCNKSTFRKKTKFYELDEKTGVLFRRKSKMKEGNARSQTPISIHS